MARHIIKGQKARYTKIFPLVQKRKAWGSLCTPASVRRAANHVLGRMWPVAVFCLGLTAKKGLHIFKWLKKISKEESRCMTHENDMKFSFPCPSIKFYGNQVTQCSLMSCLWLLLETAEVSRCGQGRMPAKPNLLIACLFIENVY